MTCRICGAKTRGPHHPFCNACPPRIFRLAKRSTQELHKIKDRYIDAVATIDYIIQQRLLTPRDKAKQQGTGIKT
jgi:hypothetical protein